MNKMPTKNNAVGAMSEAIRLIDLNGDNDGHEYIEGSEKIARAALKAFIKLLPKVKMETSTHQVRVWWHELSKMGE